jgi:phosphoglycolate phosphatase
MISPPSPGRTMLIFDLDGTLYDTTTSFLPTMRTVCQAFGTPYPGDRAILQWVGDPFDVFLDWLVAQGLPARPATLAGTIAREEHRSIMQTGALYPGVEDTLIELANRGCMLALCTNGDRPYVNAVLGKFRLLDLFSEIRTHGDTGHTKTRMVSDLLRPSRPRRAFMVGDRLQDVRAGRANGCCVVAAAYGFSDDWKTAEADLTLMRFPDLLSLRSLGSHTSED